MDVCFKVKAYRYTKNNGLWVSSICVLFRCALLKALKGTLGHHSITQSLKLRGYHSAWLGRINHLWIHFACFSANKSDNRCTDSKATTKKGVGLQMVATDHCSPSPSRLSDFVFCRPASFSVFWPMHSADLRAQVPVKNTGSPCPPSTLLSHFLAVQKHTQLLVEVMYSRALAVLLHLFPPS